ncbi:uncharacterized protein EKO05_0005217 [Ascochyta rabiei]|uniref:uncharacterized protein n=1 Tax=Didymella rabiei TaxID=5454 RepID=UPI0021F9A208|nr:uncharacterized protein EKO05_0005217 [Ascochyta rabiei]UPX14744.1 hypothetical protein EKO05_0005217 [Ascochyta rabiei]
MSSLRTSIEIAAPPEQVRLKFLDFATLSSYHSSCFQSLSASKPGAELKKGDTVRVVMANGTAFAGVVEENTPQKFSWTGTIPFLFTGTHSFHFAPSSASAQHAPSTTFTQEETFSGALGWLLMGDGLLGKGVGVKLKTRRAWERFDRDLKSVCESEVGGGVGK